MKTSSSCKKKKKVNFYSQTYCKTFCSNIIRMIWILDTFANAILSLCSYVYRTSSYLDTHLIHHLSLHRARIYELKKKKKMSVLHLTDILYTHTLYRTRQTAFYKYLICCFAVRSSGDCIILTDWTVALFTETYAV